MNSTEVKAYQWLQKQGLSVKYRPRESPVFVSTLLSFEAKLARNNTIYFGSQQVRELTGKSNIYILVFDGREEPIVNFSASELKNQPKTIHGLRVKYGVNSDPETLANLRQEAKYIPVSDFLRRLADFFEENSDGHKTEGGISQKPGDKGAGQPNP